MLLTLQEIEGANYIFRDHLGAIYAWHATRSRPVLMEGARYIVNASVTRRFVEGDGVSGRQWNVIARPRFMAAEKAALVTGVSIVVEDPRTETLYVAKVAGQGIEALGHGWSLDLSGQSRRRWVYDCDLLAPEEPGGVWLMQ
jgi:hypothetical protein